MIPLLDVCLLAALFEPAEQGDTCVGECRFNLKLCDLNLGINTNLMWGCLYGFVKRRGPLDFSITHRDARGRPLLRLGCPRALPTGLVRDRVPHDRVDDLHPLPRDGLERLVVPHPPRPALVVAPSEPVPRPDEGVAAEYQQVLELLVAPALRGG